MTTATSPRAQAEAFLGKPAAPSAVTGPPILHEARCLDCQCLGKTGNHKVAAIVSPLGGPEGRGAVRFVQTPAWCTAGVGYPEAGDPLEEVHWCAGFKAKGT
jgi:hypothetical protein